MTTKAELTAERERLAARLAEVDAQLARPEGWTLVSEQLPEENDSVLVLADREALKCPSTGGVAIAYINEDGKWTWPMPWGGEVDGKPFAWKPLSLDWLTPATESREGRYPRYFRHATSFRGGSAYIRYDDSGNGVGVLRDGSSQHCVWNLEEAERFVAADSWLEITAAEAEAMVKPVVKECLTGEATTEQMVEQDEATADLVGALNDCYRCDTKMTEAEYAAIRARILAADHSVDLRGLWEKPGEKHKGADWWLAKMKSPIGFVYVRMVYYDDEGSRGAGWYYSHHSPVNDTILALADPAALLPKIGGGA